jgi:hypothetical protein
VLSVKIDGDCIVCPWHGKRLGAIVELNTAHDASHTSNSGVSVEVDNSTLRIHGKYGSA